MKAVILKLTVSDCGVPCSKFLLNELVLKRVIAGFSSSLRLRPLLACNLTDVLHDSSEG